MKQMTRIEVLKNVSEAKLADDVNNRIAQIEKDGMTISDIQYFPKDIKDPMNGSIIRKFTVIIEWIHCEK